MEGAFLEVFRVLWGGVVAQATGVFFWDVDVLLPEELDASFLEVGWDVCWAQC